MGGDIKSILSQIPPNPLITGTATGSKEIAEIEQSILHSANASDLDHKLWEC
jgi:hypothetical protein